MGDLGQTREVIELSREGVGEVRKEGSVGKKVVGQRDNHRYSLSPPHCRLLPRPPAPPPGWTFSWAPGGHSFPLPGASTTLPQPERRQILRGPSGLTQALVSDSGTRVSAPLSVSSASTPPRLATTWSAPPAFSVCRARPHCGGGGEPPTPRPALRVAVSLGRARATRRAGAEPEAMARRSGR